MNRRVVVDLPDDGGLRFSRRMEGGWLEVSREVNPQDFHQAMSRVTKVLAWLLAATLVGCAFLAGSDRFRKPAPANQDLPHRIRMT